MEGYEDFIKAVSYVAPVPVGFEDIPGDARGYFRPSEKRIVVQEGMSESQTIKTMLHETAHAMLHDREVNSSNGQNVPAKDKRTKEVEAESIAYIVPEKNKEFQEPDKNLRTTLLWETVCAHIEHGNEADVILQKAGVENGVVIECAEIQGSGDFFVTDVCESVGRIVIDFEMPFILCVNNKYRLGG